jgi:hypothetical protein
MTRCYSNGKEVPLGDALALLVGAGKRARLLCGTMERAVPSRPVPKEEPPTVATAREGGLVWIANPVEFAIQCRSLGWTDLAIEALAQARKLGFSISLADLRRMAWDYWAWQIPVAGSDWRDIVRRLKALMEQDKAFTELHHRAGSSQKQCTR